MANVTLTPVQVIAIKQALRKISTQTHISINELNGYLSSGLMPDVVSQALLNVYRVTKLEDIPAVARTTVVTVEKVAQIYAAVQEVKELASAAPRKYLTGAEQMAVVTTIGKLKTYINELETLRAEIEAKQRLATTPADKRNLQDQKAAITKRIKASTKVYGVLLEARKGSVLEDVYNWLFVKAGIKDEKGKQLNRSLDDFHAALDKSSLPTGNQANKLINELGRVAGRGFVSPTPTTTPTPTTSPTPTPTPTTVPTPPTTPTTPTTPVTPTTTAPTTPTTTTPVTPTTTTPVTPTTTTPVTPTTTTPVTPTTTTPVTPTTTTPVTPTTTTPVTPTTTPVTPTTPTTPVTPTHTPTTTPVTPTSTPTTPVTTPTVSDVKYKTLHVSKGRRFLNWIGKHWLLLGTLVAAAGLTAAAFLGPAGMLAATAVGRFALYNVVTLGGIVVGANVFKYLFFRRHRQAATDQGHLLRREAKIQRKLRRLERYRQKINTLDQKIESYMSLGKTNGLKRYKKAIKRLQKQQAKLDKKIGKDSKFISRELEDKDAKKPYGKVKRALKIFVGHAPMAYYVDRHNKHMDILADKTNKSKFKDNRLDGNLTDEMFRWHMFRRRYIEDAKKREASAVDREVKATADGQNALAKAFASHKAKVAETQQKVRDVNPDGAHLGEPAKDLVLHDTASTHFEPDSEEKRKGKRKAEEIERIIHNGRDAMGGYSGKTAVVSKYFKNRSEDIATKTEIAGDANEAEEIKKRNTPITPSSHRTM